MEQKLRFRLVLGWLALLAKRFLADYVQLLRAFSLGFYGQKYRYFFVFVFQKLHKMKIKK